MPFTLATCLSCHLPCKALARVIIITELQRELSVMEGKETDCLIFINRKGENCGALLWTKMKQRGRYRERTPGGRNVPEQILAILLGDEKRPVCWWSRESGRKERGTAQGWSDMTQHIKKGNRRWETTASSGKNYLILTAFCLSTSQGYMSSPAWRWSLGCVQVSV